MPHGMAVGPGPGTSGPGPELSSWPMRHGARADPLLSGRHGQCERYAHGHTHVAEAEALNASAPTDPPSQMQMRASQRTRRPAKHANCIAWQPSPARFHSRDND
eukprot:scaffold169851_cov33-Tisochrysis_lutea.AAC.2